MSGTSGGGPTYTIYTGGGGQLPNPNECNSTLTSGTSGGGPTYTIYTGGGGQLPNPKSAILC